MIAITSAHLAPPPSAAATPTVAAARTLKSDYVRRLVFLTPPNEIATDDGDSDADADAAAAENFLDWYQAGVESYLANDWTSCAEYIDRALAGYRDFYAATASCRLKCRHVAAAVAPLVDADVDDLPYYESIVRRTLCLVKCKQMLLPQFDEFFAMNAWSQEVFRSRKPYTYLQLCHYRLGNVLGSAQATYTALLRNPHDAMMKTNLHFYLGKLAPEQRIEDLEQWRFASAYLAALRAYAAEDYATVVARMEESLALFRAEYDECRAFCEGDYAQGWQPDFVTSTASMWFGGGWLGGWDCVLTARVVFLCSFRADHFTYVLRCKQNCTDDLAYIRGQEYEHVFASHYEYLHISYYRGEFVAFTFCAITYFLISCQVIYRPLFIIKTHEIILI